MSQAMKRTVLPVVIVILSLAGFGFGQGITVDRTNYTPITFHVIAVNTTDDPDGQIIRVSGRADVAGSTIYYELSCLQHLASNERENNLLCKTLHAGQDYAAKMYDEVSGAIDFWQGALPKRKRILYEQYSIDSER